MKTLFKELLTQQKKAMRQNNIAELNEINKKLFAMRETQRKQKELEKEKAKDERLAQKIYKKLEIEMEV